MGRTWAEFKWADWVPQRVRDEIESFWAEKFGRGPDAWERNAQGEGSGSRACPWPAFGEEVRVICRHEEAVARGRYVHAWNSMGRVVLDDGTVVDVSGGRGRLNVSAVSCKRWHPPAPPKLDPDAATEEGRAQLNTWTVLCCVLSERQRQRHAEGWTPDHDDQHDNDDLARAAACYAKPQWRRGPWNADDTPEGWPWAAKWWKPTPGDRRRELVKAAALIVAEIERIYRQSERAARAPNPEPTSDTGDEGSRA